MLLFPLATIHTLYLTHSATQKHFVKFLGYRGTEEGTEAPTIKVPGHRRVGRRDAVELGIGWWQ